MTRIKSFPVVLLWVTLISTSCKTEVFPPRQTMDLREERTALPSFTSRSRYTADRTDTPHPTRTPMPTIPKTPGVLDCSDIVKAHKESNSVQWDGEKILLRGREYYYTGTVNSVTDNGEVHLSGSLCHATLHLVPHEIAINLSRGQLIEGYGTIKSISYYLGEDVDIDANPDLLFVR
jgi:hypothetical protein